MKHIYLSIFVFVLAFCLITTMLVAVASAKEAGVSPGQSYVNLGPTSPAQTIWYVKPDGSGDCTTWALACTLSRALALAASGDEIWVAEGIHVPEKGLPFSRMDDFSFVAWVYFDGGGNWQRIFDFGQNTSQYLFLTPKNSGGVVSFAITTNGPGAEQRLNSPNPLLTGQWVHLAVTLQDDTGRLYIDGSEVVSNTNMTLDPADIIIGNVWLGKSQFPADPNLNGKMDEVALFNRALTETEITTIISSTWTRLPNQVLGLHMEENPATDGTIISDATGWGNDGKLYTFDATNKSITGTVGLALDFDGSDDFILLPDEEEGSFRLPPGVALYGGFAGTEEERAQRDWQTNLTVLSGDLDRNDLTDPNGIITDTLNITGTNAYHVLISTNVTDTVVLDGFTITGGHADGDLLAAFGGGMANSQSNVSLLNNHFIGNAATREGGALFNSGTMTVTSCIFNSNLSRASGGGIFNQGTAMVNSSTFYNNEAHLSGGGALNRLGSLTVQNSTFSGNRASEGSFDNYGGGAIYNDAEEGPTTLTITHSTITGNSAKWGGGISGEDFYNGNPPKRGEGTYNNVDEIFITHTIVANNSVHAGGRGPNCDDLEASISSFNLESGMDCGFTGPGDLQNTDPLLGPFGDNGGTTWTHALLHGSPAIDSGDPAFMPPPGYDQRGPDYPRVVNGRIDIGAYEAWLYGYLPMVMRNWP